MKTIIKTITKISPEELDKSLIGYLEQGYEILEIFKL